MNANWETKSVGGGQLVLHCGGKAVDREELRTLPAPAAMSPTHYPIPHGELVRRTIEQMEALGVRVNGEAHAISHEGNRYFGVFGVAGGDGASASDGYQLVVGLRNSHDQSYQASLALGTRVFVCDNLAFSGDVTIARKHTKYIYRDLPGLMASAVNKIVGERRTMEERVEAYKRFNLDDLHAHDIIVRALDAGIISPPKVAGVLKEWRDPSHPEFEPRTGWSLFNGFTEALKGYQIDSVWKRSQPLHGLFDCVCGLDLKQPVIMDGKLVEGSQVIQDVLAN